MNLNKNYYKILGVDNKSDEKVIKKAYYKLSFEHHPDKGGDAILFAEMTEAYDVLCGEQRSDYDLKSKFGNNYNEYFEFFDVDFNFDYSRGKSEFENFKKNEVDDIIIEIDDTFNGSIEYERFVKCKTCDGTGKDLSSKIVIKDVDGNILKTFDGEDGCDFCEGTGKHYSGIDCPMCQGKGKVGLTPCKKCSGEKRILGKQKLSGIKLTGETTLVEFMGNCSRYSVGQVGKLYLIKK